MPLCSLLLWFLFCRPFAGEPTCTSLPEEVKEVCHFYNSTISDAKHLKDIQEINRNTVNFDFTPLFSSRCSPLSQLSFCYISFPFCSTLHDFVSPPCRSICFSVHNACYPLFTAHYQWPDYLNCLSLPLQPSLCLPTPSSPSPSLPSHSSSPPPPSSTMLPRSSNSSSSPSPSPRSRSSPSLSWSLSSLKLQSGHSPSFTATLSFFFLGHLFQLRYVFCFYQTPSAGPANTITFTLEHISSVSSPADTSPPPNVSPPPPPLPPKRKDRKSSLFIKTLAHCTQ